MYVADIKVKADSIHAIDTKNSFTFSDTIAMVLINSLECLNDQLPKAVSALYATTKIQRRIIHRIIRQPILWHSIVTSFHFCHWN